MNLSHVIPLDFHSSEFSPFPLLAYDWETSLNESCFRRSEYGKDSDGSVYRHSSLFDVKKGLTRIASKVDKNQDIYAL